MEGIKKKHDAAASYHMKREVSEVLQPVENSLE